MLKKLKRMKPVRKRFVSVLCVMMIFVLGCIGFTGCGTEKEVEEKLEDLLPGQGSRDFYRVILTGSREVDLTMLEQFPNLELRDHREAPIDIWESADADTLEGTYFRILREAMDVASEENKEQYRLAAEISRKILLGREVTL